jgi:hypothetical protein
MSWVTPDKAYDTNTQFYSIFTKKNVRIFVNYFFQMKRPQRQINTIIILITILVQSCLSKFQEVQPKFNKPLEAIVADVSTLVSYSKLTITSKKKNQSETQPTKDLIVELTDPQILTYTTADLEKLSKSISIIIKKSILNLDSYDWVTITYVTSDGSGVSDSTTQNAYVFRPYDIK